MLKFSLIYVVILIAIVGITLLFIWRRHTAESRGENIDKYIEEQEKAQMREDEAQRLSMYSEIPGTLAYRDPDIMRSYLDAPLQIYYYNEDRLDERTKQLLFGTGTAPIYDRRKSAFTYPMYQAPEYATQLQTNVPPPNRYDYLSWWDTSYV